jgi:hypothetical protein
LNLEDGRNGVAKRLMPFGLGMDDVRGHHLDVPVAAEPPLPFLLDVETRNKWEAV